jgi:hypothetical protein
MRNIFIVNAAQVVTSESHPEGVYSVVSGYPKTFDSRNYNASETNPDGDASKAYRVAKADYCAQMSAFLAADNRAMWTVTLESADGRQLLSECSGAFPVMDQAAAE